MPRLHLFELHDLDAWPRTLGDAGTAYLHALSEKMGLPALIAPTLAASLDASGADRIVDLCAGSGGPTPEIVRHLRAEGRDLTVVLTDLRPNPEAWAARSGPGVHSHAAPVDATAVPDDLPGLRTLFNAFHHFDDAGAEAILRDAVRAGQPIFIAELSERSAPAVVSAAFIPLMVWLIMPFIRPMRLEWLLLTYVVPVLPWAIAWDGLVSHLRCRAPDELLALARQIDAPGWAWDAQRVPLKGPGGLTVLTGRPTAAPTA